MRETHSVGPDADPTRLRVLDQPSPSTALNTCQRRVERGLEAVQATVALVNHLGQLAPSGRAVATACTLWCQILPEQRVVDVAAAVEIDQRLQGDLGGDVGSSRRGGQLLRGVVEGIDVCLMVLAVV